LPGRGARGTDGEAAGNGFGAGDQRDRRRRKRHLYCARREEILFVIETTLTFGAMQEAPVPVGPATQLAGWRERDAGAEATAADLPARGRLQDVERLGTVPLVVAPSA